MTTFYSYIQVEEDVGILEQGMPVKRQRSDYQIGTNLAQQTLLQSYFPKPLIKTMPLPLLL